MSGWSFSSSILGSLVSIDPSNYSDLVPADYNCTYGIQWIWNIMGQCVMDTRGLVSMCFGLLSLICWIINGAPQIIENFRTGIPDKAISPFLLAFWTIGDLTNLLGCILAHQLILQTVVSVYSIGADLILILQFVYYKTKHKSLEMAINETLGDGEILPSSDDDDDDGGEASALTTATDTQSLLAKGPGVRYGTRSLAVGFVGFVGLTLCGSSLSSFNHPTRSHLDSLPTSRHLLQLTDYGDALRANNRSSHALRIAFLPSSSVVIGYAFGIVSTVLHLCSRIPQIVQNWRRQSTEGLCLWMFFFSIIGNSSYSLQIFLTSLEPNYLLLSLPWILGSLGVLVFDFSICFQFYFFRNSRKRVFSSSVTSEQNENALILVS